MRHILKDVSHKHPLGASMSARFLSRLLIGAAPFILSLSATHAQEKTAEFRAKAAWEIQFDPVACYLKRSFEGGGADLQIEFRRSVLRDGLQAIVSGEPIRRFAGKDGLTLRWMPQNVVQKVGADVRAGAEAGTPYLTWRGSFMDTAYDQEQRVQIQGDGAEQMILHLSNMGKAIEALESCINSQRDKLGWNENIVQKPEPLGNPGTWATHPDYPPASLRAGNEGVTTFLLRLSREGSVTDCHIVHTSGFAELDEKTCVLMRERAQFQPARDAQGEAVPSQYSTRVTWKLPEWMREERDAARAASRIR
jgi:TonB family protein